MATSVDMSLDDIIKKNRERGGRGRGRPRRGRGAGGFFGNGGRIPGAPRGFFGNGGRITGAPRGFFGNGGRIPGAPRRGPLSVNTRSSQYYIAKPFRRTRSLPWKRDLLEDSIRAAGITGVEVGTKLYVSNLEYGVTNQDIRELFSEVGDLKRYALHYDKTGRSSGSAEVVFTRRSDAFAALKKYNNVLLDGKPMKIEVVGASAEMPISAQVNVTGVNGRRKRTVVMAPGTSRGRGRPPSINRASGQGRRGSGGRARGRGHPQGKKQPTERSADELDKDLDKYHAEATMQT